jgi:hypothetical protein
VARRGRPVSFRPARKTQEAALAGAAHEFTPGAAMQSMFDPLTTIAQLAH